MNKICHVEDSICDRKFNAFLTPIIKAELPLETVFEPFTLLCTNKKHTWECTAISSKKHILSPGQLFKISRKNVQIMKKKHKRWPKILKQEFQKLYRTPKQYDRFRLCAFFYNFVRSINSPSHPLYRISKSIKRTVQYPPIQSGFIRYYDYKVLLSYGITKRGYKSNKFKCADLLFDNDEVMYMNMIHPCHDSTIKINNHMQFGPFTRSFISVIDLIGTKYNIPVEILLDIIERAYNIHLTPSAYTNILLSIPYI